MRFRVLMGLSVEATDEREAFEFAKRIDELLKSPEAVMLVQLKGIRLAGDGAPDVHQPQRER